MLVFISIQSVNNVNCAHYQAGFQEPDVLALNCSSLTKTSDIFSKVMILTAYSIVDYKL